MVMVPSVPYTPWAPCVPRHFFRPPVTIVTLPHTVKRLTEARPLLRRLIKAPSFY